MIVKLKKSTVHKTPAKKRQTFRSSYSLLSESYNLSSEHSISQRAPSCPCDGGCPRCVSDSPIQAKLKIGRPNDKYEKEANRVADQVMRMPDQAIQSLPG